MPSTPAAGINLRVNVRNARFRMKAITTMLASRKLWPNAKSVHLNTFGVILFEWDYSIRTPRRNWRITDGSKPAGESNGDWTQVIFPDPRGNFGWSEGIIRRTARAGRRTARAVADSPF